MIDISIPNQSKTEVSISVTNSNKPEDFVWDGDNPLNKRQTGSKKFGTPKKDNKTVTVNVNEKININISNHENPLSNNLNRRSLASKLFDPIPQEKLLEINSKPNINKPNEEDTNKDETNDLQIVTTNISEVQTSSVKPFETIIPTDSEVSSIQPFQTIESNDIEIPTMKPFEIVEEILEIPSLKPFDMVVETNITIEAPIIEESSSTPETDIPVFESKVEIKSEANESQNKVDTTDNPIISQSNPETKPVNSIDPKSDRINKMKRVGRRSFISDGSDMKVHIPVVNHKR